MPIETVRLVATGANPSTQSIQVTVDGATGDATGTFSFSGSSAGVDSLTAYLDSKSLTSNAVQVVWQVTNGPFSVTPVSVYYRNGSGSSYFPNGASTSSFSTGPTVNSLMFNTHPKSLFPGDPHDSGNEAQPFLNNAASSAGTYAGDINIASGNLDMVFTGSFVVAAAGSVSFSAVLNSAFVMAVQGATYVSGPQIYGGVATTPFKGYTPQIGFNGSGRTWPGGNYATENFVLNFPAPGVYSFEICFTTGVYSDREFCLLANNAVIPPVSATTVPPSPAPGTGEIVLTPTSSGPLIVGHTQLITVTLSGITYTSKPYIGLLETVAGELYLFNSATANTFTLPAINGTTPDPVAAAASVFSLAGDNGSYQGRLGVVYDGSHFGLQYNGTAFDARVATTQLIVTEDDIAWYDPTTESFDLYTPSGNTGGVALSIEVDYFAMPVIASVSPTTVAADGGVHTFVVSLAKPLSPFHLSQGVTLTCAPSSNLTVTSKVQNVDSTGWLTGWTITATAAVSQTSQTGTLTLSVTGSLTYLKATAFVTETVAYVAPTAFNIALTGEASTGSSNPSKYAWAVASTGSVSGVLGISTTLTCTVLAALSNFSAGTFQVSRSGSAFASVGTAAATNIRQSGNVYLADYSLTISTAAYLSSVEYRFGFTETQADGGKVTYTDTTSYVGTASGSSGGGGGTGTGSGGGSSTEVR